VGKEDSNCASGLAHYGTGACRLKVAQPRAEPLTAVRSLHSAEVGVYNLRTESACPDRSALLAEADRAMTAGGWERLLAYLRMMTWLAVYMPRRGFSSTRMKFCLMALHDHRLVVASASGNWSRLLELAAKQMDTR